MPSQTSSPNPALGHQTHGIQDIDLAQVVSWVNADIDVGYQATVHANDLISSSINNFQRSGHKETSHHHLDTAHPESNGQIAQSKTINSVRSTKTPNTFRFTTNSPSDCQTGASQLEAWLEEFQRHENIAYQAGQS
ncbi:hypothetical protein NA56DRAFT_647913 [Hyaloscypha hepaticicola]|uniref:Uncharacterized protein n=1 Tax=Hyaloscypha hepaticicola TaxID=2082293 RepID=A0A2J6PWR2_9HELO|nr:hypothetical protein NA56DRAFT_647913 [Hyaloscypha hepaticicola]